jgi:hypothetical protein
MAKVLAYSDLQATEGNERCFNDPTLSLQQWRVRKFYSDLHAIYKKYRCEGLIDVGDTTDDRSSVPIPTLDTVIAGLDPFPTTELNIKVIGNHEQYLKDTRMHVGRIFQSKFTVIETRDILDYGEVSIVCMSYPYDDKEAGAWLDKHRCKNAFLIAHFQALGCQMSSGEAIEGIPVNKFDWVKLGLLGHVHKPQSVCRNVHYIGSPFQQNFGEAGDDKRVAVVDMDTLAVEWVPLSGYPVYETLTLPQFLKKANDTSEDRYKVVIRSQEEAASFYAHPLAHRYEPVYDYDLTTNQPVTENFVPVAGQTRSDIMTKWLNQTPPAKRGITLPDSEMIQIGEEIVTS